MSVPQVVFEVLRIIFVKILIPLCYFAAYFLFISCIITLGANIVGILGTAFFVVALVFYIKGILMYRPPIPGAQPKSVTK